MNGIPEQLQPVLAKILHENSLGASSWYEVVYHNGDEWCTYGSNTFNDGEQVIKWVYAEYAIDIGDIAHCELCGRLGCHGSCIK